MPPKFVYRAHNLLTRSNPELRLLDCFANARNDVNYQLFIIRYASVM